MFNCINSNNSAVFPGGFHKHKQLYHKCPVGGIGTSYIIVSFLNTVWRHLTDSTQELS